MYPEVLREHIQKCKKATNAPFGVNIPLLYPHSEQHIQTILDEGVKIVFTSAGNPATYTSRLKDAGVKVVHVIANTKFAKKAEASGVDAVVAEGFEAGGHNGREETTTMCLIPQITQEVSIPVIAAGGIGNGKSMLAAFALGADGVQIGSAFAVAEESSAHINFKQKIINATEGDTKLSLKQLTPVRLLKNEFYEKVEQAELNGLAKDELIQLLGKGRSRMGMFEGNLIEGELEIGQVSALLNEVKPAAGILQNIWSEFLAEKQRIGSLKF
jgi:enoyl-[acyl-carrier protein] reductase II